MRACVHVCTHMLTLKIEETRIKLIIPHHLSTSFINKLGREGGRVVKEQGRANKMHP